MDPRRYSDNWLQRELGEMADNNRNSGGGGSWPTGLAIIFLAIAAYAYSDDLKDLVRLESSEAKKERLERNIKYPAIVVGLYPSGMAGSAINPDLMIAYSRACKAELGCNFSVRIPAGAPKCITYKTDLNNIQKWALFYKVSPYGSSDQEIAKDFCGGFSYKKVYFDNCVKRTQTVCNYK